jgi:hypothetical protein
MMAIGSSALVLAALARRRILRGTTGGRLRSWARTRTDRVHHVMDSVAAAGWQIAQPPTATSTSCSPAPARSIPKPSPRLRSVVTARGAVARTVQVQTVDAIPRTPLGKAPLFVGPTTPIPP